MKKDDWLEVEQIYLEGIASKNATFEKTSPGWEVWDKNHLAEPRFVVEIDEKVAGWAALSAVSSRCVYAGVAEVSVYVGEKYKGRGVGSILLQALITESEKRGIWTLQAGIFPENAGSLALHHKYGFRTIGGREKLGKMDDIWRDVLILERRSKVAGL